MTSLVLRYSKCTALPPDTGTGLKYRTFPAGVHCQRSYRTCACMSLDRSFGFDGLVKLIALILPCFDIFENQTFLELSHRKDIGDFLSSEEHK